MQIARLENDNFQKFLAGEIDGSANGSVTYVLTVLEIINNGVYFEPGFDNMHKTMLARLGGDVKSVGFAGRISEKRYGDFAINIIPGGKSMEGYSKRRVAEFTALIDGWLLELGDERKTSVDW